MKGNRELVRREFFAGFCSLITLMAFGCSEKQPDIKPSAGGEGPLGFARDIKGIMVKFCFECHGAKNTESGLDLRTVESMLKGGETGPAIVVGKPGESLLFEMIKDEKMPPEGVMPGAGDIEQIRQWIASGAQP